MREALAILCAFTVLITAPSISASAPYRPQTYNFKIGTAQFTLQELDVGTTYGCVPGTQVGVALKDADDYVRWSLNVSNTASYLAVHGCKRLVFGDGHPTSELQTRQPDE